LTGSALIVGLGLNGLGVARSLKAAGIRAHALDDNLASIYAATNACTKSPAALAGEGLIAALAAYRSTTDHDPVLFLTREDGVATVAANRGRIGGYRIAMPEPAVVTALVNKDRFLAIAHAADILIPRTVTLQSRDDVACLGELTPPFIVKPTAHIAAYQARYRKAYIFGSIAEAEQTVRGMIDVAGEVVGQDYVPGGDGSVFFCLGYFGEGGTMLAGYTGYKTASWPPRVGGTGGCAPAPGAHAELAEATERFFKTAGFRGMGSLEFKRHAETGRFYMIEPPYSSPNRCGSRYRRRGRRRAAAGAIRPPSRRARRYQGRVTAGARSMPSGAPTTLDQDCAWSAAVSAAGSASCLAGDDCLTRTRLEERSCSTRCERSTTTCGWRPANVLPGSAIMAWRCLTTPASMPLSPPVSAGSAARRTCRQATMAVLRATITSARAGRRAIPRPPAISCRRCWRRARRRGRGACSTGCARSSFPTAVSRVARSTRGRCNR
jgi:hypothetical protein